MKNLLILEDRSSEEEESSDQLVQGKPQEEVRDSPSESTTGQPGVVPSAVQSGDSQCSDDTRG